MEDTKLLEKCPHCGTSLTLMESISMINNQKYLVKRCLSCGNYPVQEVLLIDAALRQYRKPEPWIPVSERLPSKDDADDDGFVLIHTIDWHATGICKYSEVDDGITTHWKRMPEPPEEDAL